MEGPSLKRIRINVGGKVFETTKSTLQKDNRSKLTGLSESSIHYDEEAKEYFFDRNPFLFAPILDYHRTGELHFTHCICPAQVRKELEYWEIEHTHLSECCQRWFQSSDEYDYYSTMLQDWLDKMDKEERYCNDLLRRKGNSKKSRWKRCQIHIWRFFEYPNTSLAAKVRKVSFLHNTLPIIRRIN